MAVTTHVAIAADAIPGKPNYPPREYRHPVVIEARMRSGGGWVTVCIRNISAHGLLGQMGTPPAPGTYIEIHRGAHTIIGRTVWSRGRKFGVRTQNLLDVEAIISDPMPGRQAAARLPDGRVIADRRSDIRRPSAADRYEESVRFSRKFQTLIFFATAIAAATLLAEMLFVQLADVASTAGKVLG
jgi:hypothetical protein